MRRGFTLVELAIVLVIIGFLIAMGVKGTELIKEAQAQKEAYKFKKISAAIGTIYNKRGYLPYDGWSGKYSTEAGEYVRPPKDGIIQFWESGGFRWYLVNDGLLDWEDLTIMDTPTFFSAGKNTRLQHNDGSDWAWIFGFNPGTVWNGGDVKESLDFGTGAYTLLVLAQYDSKTYTFKEDTRENQDDEANCDNDCSDGLCDINNDGDCEDSYTYWQPYKVRSGPADLAAYMLDKKGDATTGWASGAFRIALRYDPREKKYYRLNTALKDDNSDGRPEATEPEKKYQWNTEEPNQNFVAYKIW